MNDPAFARAVGARLHEARTRAGFTQVQLFVYVGIEHSRMSAYEHGKRLPGIQTLARLCDIFDVSADWVLGRKDGE